MDVESERLKAIAEAACSLVESLTAGLLQRPVPATGQPPLSVDALTREIAALLAEAVPALEGAALDLAEAELDDIEEAVDDVGAPALDCVDMARRIWEAPLPAEAEGARPLLAALVEAPVVALLGLLHPVIHAVVDPFAVFDDVERPVLGMELEVDLSTQLAALAVWRRACPGVLPDDILPG